MTELFLDTSYAIALASPSDKHHERAVALASQIESDSKTRLVTTRAVLLEIGNALARQRYRGVAVRLLNALENDSAVEIDPFSEGLYANAAQLFRTEVDGTVHHGPVVKGMRRIIVETPRGNAPRVLGAALGTRQRAGRRARSRRRPADR